MQDTSQTPRNSSATRICVLQNRKSRCSPEKQMTISVLEAYELWAASYDDMPNTTRDLDGRCLRDDLAGEPLGQILEVGCGTGKNTRWLTSRGPVIGLDFSAKMLSKCRRSAPEAALHLADLNETWPIADGSVETVLIDLVLEHIEDLPHFARECARVLRPKGRLRLSELHPSRQAEGKAARFEHGGAQVTVPAYVHSTEGYVTAFGDAGFELRRRREPRATSDAMHRPPRLLILEFTFGACAPPKHI